MHTCLALFLSLRASSLSLIAPGPHRRRLDVRTYCVKYVYFVLISIRSAIRCIVYNTYYYLYLYFICILYCVTLLCPRRRTLPRWTKSYHDAG